MHTVHVENTETSSPKPCPSCGHCPTCGRRDWLYPARPPQPYTAPYDPFGPWRPMWTTTTTSG